MGGKGNAASRAWTFVPPAGGYWRHVWSVSFFGFALACLLYLPTLDHAYFADDHTYLGFGSSKLIGLPPSELPRLLVERMNPWEFLPLRDFSYWLDIAVWGGFPDGFHLSNILWYAFACLSAGLLIRALLDWVGECDGGRRQALVMLGLALFALHPAHVEPVAWIAGRKDLMAGTFGLWALACFIQGIEGGHSLRRLFQSCLLLLATLFSKGAAVGLVLLFPILVAARRGKALPVSGRLFAYFALPLLIGVTGSLLHSVVGTETGIAVINTVPPMDVLERVSRIWATLLGIMLWPVDLRLIYDVYGLPAWHWAVLVGSLAGVMWAGWSLLQGRRSLAAVGILLAAASCLPYLQLAPFATWSMASERFVFVALLGPILVGLDLIMKVRRKEIVSAMLLALMISGSVFLIQKRVEEWAWPRTLGESQFQITPTYYSGLRLYLETNSIADKDFEGALRRVERVPRPDARDLLAGWIDFAAESSVEGGAVLPSLGKRACAKAAILSAHIEQEFKRARSEKDVAYNSLLRTINRYLDRNVPNLKESCPRAIAP